MYIRRPIITNTPETLVLRIQREAGVNNASDNRNLVLDKEINLANTKYDLN